MRFWLYSWFDFSLIWRKHDPLKDKVNMFCLSSSMFISSFFSLFQDPFVIIFKTAQETKTQTLYDKVVVARENGTEVCVNHRIDSVLCFFSSRLNWDPSPPHPQASGSTPLVPKGGGGVHKGWGKLGLGHWGVPICTRGQILWYSRYICTLLC